jgi:hypothetical protein
MTPGLRKLVLTTHITISVGWLGAVAGFLVLSIAALTSRDAEAVRGAYFAMNLTAWFVIVPFALGSLLTGIVQSLGTTWGLFRHYWVVAKLLLTVVATMVLLLKMKLIGYVAGVAATTSLSSADLSKPRMELAVHSGGGLLVLLVITTLSVFKPWGLTRYGHRKVQEQCSAPPQLAKVTPAPWGLKVLFAVIGVLVAGFIVLHLTGHGSAIHTMHHH